MSSQDKIKQSQRNGFHATVYDVRRDPGLQNKDIIRDKTKPVFPFVGGSSYKGQWMGDMKQGFGIKMNTNDTKYEGEWVANKYHGRGTLWIKSDRNKYIRQYVGQWEYGLMHGDGTFYYANGDIYRGLWTDSKKSGNGKMEYPSGDVYQGSWNNDKKDGFGTMWYANGNIFEGFWQGDQKEGSGLFYYLSTDKIYEGEWSEDQPRCGEYREPKQPEKFRFHRPHIKHDQKVAYGLPELALADPASVIDRSLAEVRMSKLQNSTLHDTPNFGGVIEAEYLDKALAVFNELSEDQETIMIFKLGEVLKHLGLNILPEDINEIITQLEMKDAMDVSFSEAVEIAIYIHERVY